MNDNTTPLRVKAVSLFGICTLETWYLAYALLGTAVGGILPIIMPLLAFKCFEGACQVGLVMAAFNLGWLLSPLWGHLADRHSLHRELLIISLLFLSVILTALSYAVSLRAWLGLSLAGGVCVSGAMTQGSLFIVEKNPQQEWSERIGCLQMFNGGGQVVGMLVAALLSDMSLTGALLVAAGITVLAVFPGRLTPKVIAEKCRLEIQPSSNSIQNQGQGQQCCPNQKLPFLSRAKEMLENLNPNFLWFMVLWFLCLTGSSVIYTLYPIIMQDAYGIGQRHLAFGFACAMGISVLLYAEAGRCNQRFGPSRIIRVILVIRLLAFVGLLALLSVDMFKSSTLTFFSFFIIFLCWPFLGVSGTTLTARLSNLVKGEGIGIFHAVFAMAAVVGAAMGGWLASWGGYAVAVGMATVTEAFGLIILGRVCAPQLRQL
jgi:MFS family permease